LADGKDRPPRARRDLRTPLWTAAGRIVTGRRRSSAIDDDTGWNQFLRITHAASRARKNFTRARATFAGANASLCFRPLPAPPGVSRAIRAEVRLFPASEKENAGHSNRADPRYARRKHPEDSASRPQAGHDVESGKKKILGRGTGPAESGLAHGLVLAGPNAHGRVLSRVQSADGWCNSPCCSTKQEEPGLLPLPIGHIDDFFEEQKRSGLRRRAGPEKPGVGAGESAAFMGPNSSDRSQIRAGSPPVDGDETGQLRSLRVVVPRGAAPTVPCGCLVLAPK